MNTNKCIKQMLSWLVIFTTVFVVLFSTIFIAEHYNHSCSEPDCQVCAIVEQCSNILKTVGSAIVVAIVAVLLFLTLQNACKIYCDAVVCNSLIIQKSRMNI